LKISGKNISFEDLINKKPEQKVKFLCLEKQYLNLLTDVKTPQWTFCSWWNNYFQSKT